MKKSIENTTVTTTVANLNGLKIVDKQAQALALVEIDNAKTTAFSNAVKNALNASSATRTAFEGAICAFILGADKAELCEEITHSPLAIQKTECAEESRKKRALDNVLKPVRQAWATYDFFKELQGFAHTAKNKAVTSQDYLDNLAKLVASFCDKKGVRAHCPKGASEYKKQQENAKKAREEKNAQKQAQKIAQQKSAEYAEKRAKSLFGESLFSNDVDGVEAVIDRLWDILNNGNTFKPFQIKEISENITQFSKSLSELANRLTDSESVEKSA